MAILPSVLFYITSLHRQESDEGKGKDIDQRNHNYARNIICRQVLNVSCHPYIFDYIKSLQD